METKELSEFGIEMVEYSPELEEKDSKTMAKWIFHDSDFLPLTCNFLGYGEKKGITGKTIPVMVFNNGQQPFLISKWNRLISIPMPLSVGDKVTIYIEKSANPRMVILKLN